MFTNIQFPINGKDRQLDSTTAGFGAQQRMHQACCVDNGIVCGCVFGCACLLRVCVCLRVRVPTEVTFNLSFAAVGRTDSSCPFQKCKRMDRDGKLQFSSVIFMLCLYDRITIAVSILLYRLKED